MDDPKRIDVSLIEPGQEIEIALMRPQDAPGVAALFSAVYGEDYPVKTYYQPEELCRANQEGSIISVVTRTPKDDIVGHNAMYRIAPCPKVYEGGAGLVLPAYRNTAQLFGRMVARGIEAVPRFGGEGVYGEFVCNHIFTQKLADRLGNTPMGLEVDLMPAEAYEQEKSAQGRVSSLFGLISLKPYSHTVYAPPVYEEALGFIYGGFIEERRLEIADQEPPQGSLSRLSAEIYDQAQVTRITVWEMGGDLLEALAAREAEAAARSVGVYQVWLPLAKPWVGWAVDRLRSQGYFLGGVLPRWFDEDGLLMQRLTHTPDWDAMQLYLERSQIITGFVKDDWAQAAGAGR